MSTTTGFPQIVKIVEGTSPLRVETKATPAMATNIFASEWIFDDIPIISDGNFGIKSEIVADEVGWIDASSFSKFMIRGQIESILEKEDSGELTILMSDDKFNVTEQVIPINSTRKNIFGKIAIQNYLEQYIVASKYIKFSAANTQEDIIEVSANIFIPREG
jgi:hypothetical protein